MDGWYTLTGRPARIQVPKYLIDWDGDSLSGYQEKVKAFLRTRWEKTKIVCEEFPCVGTKLSLDFVNISDRIAIEVQGEQHLAFSEHFHRNSEANYRAQLKRDILKEKWCGRNALTYVEIYPQDIPALSEEWFLSKYGIVL